MGTSGGNNCCVEEKRRKFLLVFLYITKLNISKDPLIDLVIVEILHE